MATFDSYFYNSVDGDRLYDADSMIDWLFPFFTTGVFNGNFHVIANNSMSVTLKGGYCNINGRIGHQTGDAILDLPIASGNLARIDIVALRRNDTAREIYPLVVSGAFSNNPTPPALIRENGIYDLQLAAIRVNAGTIAVTQADITDTRMNPALCGWVASTVEEIDFSQITAQFESFFTQYRGYAVNIYNMYNAYIQGLQEQAQGENQEFSDSLNAYQDSAEQNVTAIIQNFVDWLGAFQSGKETDFNSWFSQIQDLLSGDQAANLAAEITQHGQKTADSSGGVHGVKYRDGVLYIYDGGGIAPGWVEIGHALKGALRWIYIESLDYTFVQWDSFGNSWEEFENQIEKEAA
jgi:hypothetical protein